MSLVLSRNRGQSIIIGKNILIKIISIKNKQVKILIQSPKETLIFREEIFSKLFGKFPNNETDLLRLKENV